MQRPAILQSLLPGRNLDVMIGTAGWVNTVSEQARQSETCILLTWMER
jgi:hypothetical protein